MAWQMARNGPPKLHWSTELIEPTALDASGLRTVAAYTMRACNWTTENIPVDGIETRARFALRFCGN